MNTRRLAILLPALVGFLAPSSTAFGFQPSPTSPYTFGIVYAPISQDIQGDGNWHDSACQQSGPPNYFCPNPPCPIGVSGNPSVIPAIFPPYASIENGKLAVEYFLRNAYCNPPSDFGPIYEPNSIPYYITIVSIDALGNRSTVMNFDPYWEHGKASNLFSVDSNHCYQAIYVLATGFPVTYTFVSSNSVGLPSSPCPDDRQKCGASAGSPINVGSGNMRYEEALFSVAESASPLAFSIAYNSKNKAAGPLGYGFTHTFSQKMGFFSLDQKILVWTNGHGEQTLFYAGGTPGSNPYAAIWPADARGTVLYNTSLGRFTLTDLDGTVTQFDVATAHWLSTTDRWGNAITGTYTGANLTSIGDPEGRVWTLGYSGSFLSSILDPDGHQWRFTVDGSSHLQSAFDPLHTGATPWRQYTYVTGKTGDPTVLASAADESGAVLEGHEYDSTGRATSSWSGDTVVTNGVPHPGPNARSKVTISYDSSTQSTVTSQIDATNNLVSVFTLTFQPGRYLPTSIVGNCPSCSIGGDDSQTYTYDGNGHMLTKIVGIGAEQAETDFSYDYYGMALSRTEAVGKAEQRVTTYTYNYAAGTPSGGPPWPSFVTSVSETSAAKPLGSQKVTSYSWNATGARETTLTTSVSGYLLFGDASQTTYTTTSVFDGASPVKHRLLEVDGPEQAGQPTSNRKTVYTYYTDISPTPLDSRGRPQTVAVYTSAAAHLDTTYDNYDIFGTARKVVDPNVVETDKTTDAKGRVTSVVSKKPLSDGNELPDYTTTYSFDPRDRLSDVTLPLGNRLHYEYEDGTNRLLDTLRVDAFGYQQERLHLTLNAIGNKTQEDAQSCNAPAASCAVWTTKRTDSFAYDPHDRLASVIHPDASHTDYAYDSRGNLVSVKDERHAAANVLYAYDFLNRLTLVTQKQVLTPGPDVVTGYIFDVQDNLASVTDPNGNITTYAYDDFRRLQTQSSPVSGATSYSYDPAGNLLSSTDANGATTARVYDSANRVTSAVSTRAGFSTETVNWTYDDATAGNYGKGRLATMTDPSGSASYAYERRGLLRSESRTIQGNPYSLTYLHDANGNRQVITYPSGGLVRYTFDFADRPLTACGNAGPTCIGGPSYVSAAQYQPFGPESTLSYGNGTTRTVSYDLRYRPTQIQLAGASRIADYRYAEDAVGNITSICAVQPCPTPSAAYDRVFGYDDLNRLTTANSGVFLWGTATGNGYAYDKMGNVTSITLGTSRTAAFTYSGTLPKLSSVTETVLGTRSVSYDAAANETAVGASAFAYSTRNNLATADGLTYTYDGRGLRTIVQDGSGNKRYFFYSPEMNLLEETSFSPTPTTAGGYDYVWFNGHPVAEKDGGTHWTFTDHLGTPLIQTDLAGTVFWRAEYEPYGSIFTLRTGDQHQPLRLPGQEAEQLNLGLNGATERSYNIFRWYRPTWGRYTQSDASAADLVAFTPWNSIFYEYADANPISLMDPTGQKPWRYGHYCGPGQNPGRLDPINGLDRACQQHDDCYARIGRGGFNLPGYCDQWNCDKDLCAYVRSHKPADKKQAVVYAVIIPAFCYPAPPGCGVCPPSFPPGVPVPPGFPPIITF